MSFMFEVYYPAPQDVARASSLSKVVSRYGGHVGYYEVLSDRATNSVCLTYEFQDLASAEAAASALRALGEHVEGPVDYGPETAERNLTRP